MSKKVLLIADDDEMNRMIIKKFLGDTYKIVEASDGQETMDLLKKHHIDVLLLDIIMPKLDGLEVLQLIQEEPEDTDMGILVATSTKEKTERVALSLGADDIVSKPYDPVVIHKRLENIIAMKEIQKQKRLLQNSDFDAAFNQEKEKMTANLKESIERIVKLTDLIIKNKSNTKLVEEMAEDIQKESDQMEQFLSNEK